MLGPTHPFGTIASLETSAGIGYDMPANRNVLTENLIASNGVGIDAQQQHHQHNLGPAKYRTAEQGRGAQTGNASATIARNRVEGNDGMASSPGCTPIRATAFTDNSENGISSTAGRQTKPTRPTIEENDVRLEREVTASATTRALLRSRATTTRGRNGDDGIDVDGQRLLGRRVAAWSLDGGHCRRAAGYSEASG